MKHLQTKSRHTHPQKKAPTRQNNEYVLEKKKMTKAAVMKSLHFDKGRSQQNYYSHIYGGGE